MGAARAAAGGRVAGVTEYISSRLAPPDADFFLQHTEPGSGAVLVVDYSGDSKTDELIKLSTIFRFPQGHGRIFAKIKK